MGLTWLLEEKFEDNGWKKVMRASREGLGLFGVLCVAFFEVAQVHRRESYRTQNTVSQPERFIC